MTQRKPVAPTLSSGPGATGPARRVYELLRDLESAARSGSKKQTILGQHCQAHKEDRVGEYWRKAGEITAAGGGVPRHPGFVELDFGPGNYRATYDAPWVEDAVAFARERFTRGEAIVGFCFHQSYPGAPVKSWENCFPQAGMDDAWFARVTDGKSAEYRALTADLAFAADRLARLQEAGVPVLFRPFHEMNKHRDHRPFWWSARDPARYRRLWALAHDYLVKARGLRNLLFVWSPYEWDGTYGTDPFDYYPGDDRVDSVGVDLYHGNPPYPPKFYDDLRRYPKPRMVAECDRMPVRGGDDRFPAVAEIDARPWTVWTIWGDCLLHEVGTDKPNVWNTSADHKAIRDTYAYRSADGVPRVLSGGPNPTFGWSRLK